MQSMRGKRDDDSLPESSITSWTFLNLDECCPSGSPCSDLCLVCCIESWYAKTGSGGRRSRTWIMCMSSCGLEANTNLLMHSALEIAFYLRCESYIYSLR